MYKTDDLEVEFEEGVSLVLLVGGGKIIYIGGLSEVQEMIFDLKQIEKQLKNKLFKMLKNA